MEKYLISVLLLFTIGVIQTFSQEPSTKQERNLVTEGNKLFRADKYHEALEKYEQALASNPSYQYALYNKAVTLSKLASDDNKNTENDPREVAKKIFSDIAKLKTNEELTAKSFYNLGNMAYNDEQYDQAINMYKNSLRIEPDNKECRQNLLLALQKQQENENNQDNQQQDQQEQQQQEQEQEQPEQQEQQPQEPQPMTQSAEQLLQAMQNKENATRRRTNEQESSPSRRTTDKPW